MIKDILDNLEPSSTLKINETCRLLEKKGKKIFKFGFGQSPFQIPKDIVNELKNKFVKDRFRLSGLIENIVLCETFRSH